MKRAMTTSVVAGLLGTLGFAPAVSAETTIYGSVRSGIYMKAPQMAGKENTLDIGSVDGGDIGSMDKLWSRIGVKSSTELDGGMTAGLHIEKRLDRFRTRHQNVWMSGAFGKVTLGQQGSPYHSHTNWDNSNLFGNANGFAGSRLQGISYASTLVGPFNLSALVTDDNMAGSGDGDGLDIFEMGGTLSAGPLSIGAGYRNSDGMDLVGGKVGGSLGGVGWALAFESKTTDDDMDGNRYGFNVDYSTEAGRAYVYYEDKQLDDKMHKNHGNHMLLGYSHTIGPGVVVIAEYQLPSNKENSKQSAVAVRVDF